MNAGTATLERGALWYAKQGWPVFPLAYKLKTPLFPTRHKKGGSCRGECGEVGHGFHDATTDPNVIREWWNRYPTANIGIRTGVAFDAFDVDGDPFEVCAEWPAIDLPGGPVVQTSRGFQFYFLPTGRGSRADMRGDGSLVDWRGIGGYVVAPPSVHPSGAVYRWYTKPTVALQSAPSDLIDYLWPTSTPAVPLQRPSSAPLRVKGKSGAWNPAGVLKHLEGAVEGNRNESLRWCAERVGIAVAEGKCDAETFKATLNDLEAVALRIGLTEYETEKTIRSGFGRGVTGNVGRRNG